MNSTGDEVAILAAMERWNQSRIFPGKRRDTKKKLDRMIMTRNSRRDNR